VDQARDRHGLLISNGIFGVAVDMPEFKCVGQYLQQQRVEGIALFYQRRKISCHPEWEIMPAVKHYLGSVNLAKIQQFTQVTK
jgi:hypothetical protein